MMKHYIKITGVLCMVFMMAACGDADSAESGNNIDTLREQNEWMETRIAELKEENEALRSEISALVPEDVETVEEDNEEIEEEIEE